MTGKPEMSCSHPGFVGGEPGNVGYPKARRIAGYYSLRGCSLIDLLEQLLFEGQIFADRLYDQRCGSKSPRKSLEPERREMPLSA